MRLPAALSLWKHLHRPSRWVDLIQEEFTMSNESPSKIKCKGIIRSPLWSKTWSRLRKLLELLVSARGPFLSGRLPWSTTANTMGNGLGPGKIALAQVGGVQLELVQPVEGPSIYRDWLKEHGEGLHHMNFLVDDVDEACRMLSAQGFPSLQSGKFGPAEQKGAYNYVDIKPLRAIWNRCTSEKKSARNP